MEEGEIATLVAVVSPKHGLHDDILWGTSNQKVATVNNGEVTAISEGTATITASAGGKSAMCDVVVNKRIIAVESVVLSDTSLDLTEGEEYTLTVTVIPDNATNPTILWTSSDNTVAEVDEGRIKAIREGVAVISASVENVSATCQVNVHQKPIPVASITLDKPYLELCVGEDAVLMATISPGDATDQTVTWSSTDNTVATVANGRVSPLKNGLTTIVASSGDQRAECIISVGNYIISFADPLVKLVLVSHFDTNHDGELTRYEASNVSDLFSHFFGNYEKGIKSFDEFQFLTGLKTIPSEAFQSCESLESVIIPEGVEEIGSMAFAWCYKLRRISLPSTLKYIREYGIFATSLEEIILPEGLIEIGNHALAANHLKTIRIPNNVRSFGVGFLRECNYLESIYSQFSSTDNRCFIKDGVLMAFAPFGLDEYTTPDETKVIGKNAFNGLNAPKKLTFNEGVIEIQTATFEYNMAVETIVLPSTILTVCSLGYSKTIYCKAINPPINGLYGYSYDPDDLKGRTLYVPMGSVDLYKASDWKEANIIGLDY